MKKIDLILNHIEDQRISIASFERRSELTHGYLHTTKKSSKDISEKKLGIIKAHTPEDYYHIFPEELKDANTVGEGEKGTCCSPLNCPPEMCEIIIKENELLIKIIELQEQILKSKYRIQ